MSESLFRKSSIEKINSPENLNEFIKGTNPGAWGVLTGFFVIVLAIGFWAFTGTIPDTLPVDCTVFSQGTELFLYAYLPYSTAKRLTKGLAVQISPEYAPREEYGYIFGEISSIGSESVNDTDLERFQKKYGNLQSPQKGNYVEIVISLLKTNGALQWSNSKSTSILLENGVYCKGMIVIKQRKPYQLVIN